MSWEKCKPCVISSRSTFTSTLYKVLTAIKMMQGTCQGINGIKVEDIAMYMVKNYCLDGDVKSQVIASLKCGVKKSFIFKKKDRFGLITPAAAVHLASCKCRPLEIERTANIFPSSWFNPCGGPRQVSSKRRRRPTGEPPCGSSRRRRPPRKKRKGPASCASNPSCCDDQISTEDSAGFEDDAEDDETNCGCTSNGSNSEEGWEPKKSPKWKRCSETESDDDCCPKSM